MKLFLVCGSHNENSQSIKVTHFLSERAKKKGFDQIFVLDLAKNPLPLWTPDFETYSAGNISYPSLLQEVKSSEAFIVLTPEWNGMATPGIKNFFLYFSNPALFHKPALIVTVSAGHGGAYPVIELRSSGYKNTKLCYIPEHVIVRDAEDVLNDITPCSKADIFIRKRIDFCLLVLREYGEALLKVRSAQVDYEEFLYGM